MQELDNSERTQQALSLPGRLAGLSCFLYWASPPSSPCSQGQRACGQGSLTLLSLSLAGLKTSGLGVELEGKAPSAFWEASEQTFFGVELGSLHNLLLIFFPV